MKHKFLTLISVLLIACTFFSMTAYAATVDEDSKSTAITYTKQENTVTEPSRPIYEIAIPAEMSLNSGNTMPIYLTENNLSSGQILTVYVDGDRTISSDGYLHLQGTQGQTPAEVAIGYYNSSGNPVYINNTGIWEVAAFDNSKVHPIRYGTLFFNLENDSELIADTYAGTVHFLLRVTTE